MHITDYERVERLADTDIFLIDGERGTKIISSKNAKDSFFESNEFRGGVNSQIEVSPCIRITHRNLGTHITDEQVAAIDRADRSIVNYGDFWQLDTGEMFVVIDFDTLWQGNRYVLPGQSDVSFCTKRHAVIIETLGVSAEMYHTNNNISSTGYATCSWRAKLDGQRVQSRNAMSRCFNEIMRYMDYHVSAINNSFTCINELSDVELLTPEMLGFGTTIYGNTPDIVDKPSVSPLLMTQNPLEGLNKTFWVPLSVPFSGDQIFIYLEGRVRKTFPAQAHLYPIPYAYVR